MQSATRCPRPLSWLTKQTPLASASFQKRHDTNATSDPDSFNQCELARKYYSCNDCVHIGGMEPKAPGGFLMQNVALVAIAALLMAGCATSAQHEASRIGQALTTEKSEADACLAKAHQSDT